MENAHTLGLTLPLWSTAPFAGLILSIALFPVFAPRFWARHFGKVSLAFGLPVGLYFLLKLPRELIHASLDYVSFIILLASLFIVSGGILVRGTMRATPALNCGFLAAGAVLSNLLGTTGSSMLLIRPLLRANAGRKRAHHVVIFFIFIVANIGGSLTAIGDPPLFLGYLKGVPFFWTLRNIGAIWLVACGILLGIFFLVDSRAFALERGTGDDPLPPDATPSGGSTPFSIDGKVNILLLGALIGAVFLPSPWRETAMASTAAASIWMTPAKVRRENEFTYHPIQEVAILFAGIFATMIPAILILKARGGELGVTEAAQFFWASGSLSSFLDNAPTYLAFFALAGSLGSGMGVADLVASVPAPLLAAISAGSVFMGANTYIGNAPNFMVKAIAEENGIRMPSFFGYMLWSCTFLLPLFGLITLVFF